MRSSRLGGSHGVQGIPVFLIRGAVWPVWPHRHEGWVVITCPEAGDELTRQIFTHTRSAADLPRGLGAPVWSWGSLRCGLDLGKGECK